MKRISIIILAIVIITGIACRKYLDKAYLNPNQPVTAIPEDVLPAMISNMHRGMAFDARSLGPFVQYFSRTGGGDPWERHGYVPGSDAGGEIWRMHYWNFGWNLLDMINNGYSQEKFDYAAVAYTLLAWGWLNLADVHGDVILKQAFERDRLTFDYDKQEEVYPHVLNLIDSAIVAFNQAAGMGSSTLAVGDKYLYEGNLDKWKKFAYGVKAKAFHRYFNKGDYKPDSVIKYADLSLASVADDAMVKFNPSPPDATGLNFFGPTRNNLGSFRAGAFPVNLMNGAVFVSAQPDPRLRYIFKPSGDGQFRGLVLNTGETSCTNPAPPAPPTCPRVTQIPNFWGFNNVFTAPTGGIDTGARTYFKNTSPFPIMTYAEIQFIKAEAAWKKGLYPTALTAYKNGIRGSIDMYSTYFTGYVNFNATQRDGYVDDPAVSPANPADLTRKMILLQKYIALWGWGFVETWVDMRKENYDVTNIYTGYTIPAGTTNLYPDNAGKLVYRLRPRYNSEYLWNVEALKGIGALNADYHTYPVWFSEP